MASVVGKGHSKFLHAGSAGDRLTRQKDCSPWFCPLCGQRPVRQGSLSGASVFGYFCRTKVTRPSAAMSGRM
jgi:hypothetical protein